MEAVAEKGTELKSENISLSQLGAMLGKTSSQRGTSAAAPETTSEQAAEGGEQNATTTELEPTALAEAAAAETEVQEPEVIEAEVVAEKPAKLSQEVWDAINAAKLDKGGAKLVGRIHEVVDQRDAERNARVEAERKLAELTAARTAPDAAQQQAAAAAVLPGREVFERDASVQQMNEQLQSVEEVLRWARKNPDGGTVTTDKGEVEYSADQVQRYTEWADSERVRLMAERSTTVAQLRHDFMQARQTNFAKAVQLYPWLENKGSPEFQQALEVIRQNPGVVHTPDMELRVARYVEGLKLETANAKKTATPPARRNGTNPPPVVTHSPNGTSRNGSAAKPAAAAEAQFKTSGRVDDLGKMLVEQRRARRQAA